MSTSYPCLETSSIVWQLFVILTSASCRGRSEPSDGHSTCTCRSLIFFSFLLCIGVLGKHCSGTMLTDVIGITAAHCVSNYTSSIFTDYEPNTIQVRYETYKIISFSFFLNLGLTCIRILSRDGRNSCF